MRPVEVTLHFSRQMASLELQRKAPAGAESGDSALQGTIVLRPSRTISSGGGFKVNGRGLMGSAWVYTILYSPLYTSSNIS